MESNKNEANLFERIFEKSYLYPKCSSCKSSVDFESNIWRCINCEFFLCNGCETNFCNSNKNIHDKTHVFYKMNYPTKPKHYHQIDQILYKVKKGEIRNEGPTTYCDIRENCKSEFGSQFKQGKNKIGNIWNPTKMTQICLREYLKNLISIQNAALAKALLILRVIFGDA
eukprot:TRINITY_DN14910_c0_g1_i1.p1 TRINITY_DN14910_c0_g1~~TRINITY_DN14910_c0_g1_i1.p1  ORF type:complete len:170 (-),score=34.66 TRINITY_DN14910_c0_g1_i1:307-816(-)